MNNLMKSFKLIQAYKKEIEALQLLIQALKMKMTGEDKDIEIELEIGQIGNRITDIQSNLKIEQGKYRSYLNTYKALDYKNKEQYQKSVEDWQKLFEEMCLQKDVNMSELLFVAYKAGRKFKVIQTDDAWGEGDYHTIITDETGYWYGEAKDHDSQLLKKILMDSINQSYPEIFNDKFELYYSNKK